MFLYSSKFISGILMEGFAYTCVVANITFKSSKKCLTGIYIKKKKIESLQMGMYVCVQCEMHIPFLPASPLLKPSFRK